MAIQDTPFATLHDWAWADGIQQVWGLGVPLIQLPFEVLAKAFGFAGFPDRLGFVLCYAAAAAGFFLASRKSDAPAPRFRDGRAAAETLVCFLAPVLLSLVASRFHDYERAIAYGWLWSMALLSLLIVYLRKPDPRLFAGICAAAGFAPWVRPTIAFYGLAAVAAAWAARPPSRRTAANGVALLVAGIAGLLASNAWRFGAPLEFGHSLTFVDEPRLDYSLKFDYPYGREPVASAALELGAAVFLGPELNGLDFYRPGIHPWFSETPRVREFAFSTFAGWGVLWLAAAAAAWGMRRGGRETRAISAWALLSFGGLFVFYLRVPMLASRYVADFGPAIGAATVAAYRLALGEAERRVRKRRALPVFGLITALFFALWAAELLGRTGNPRYRLITPSTAGELTGHPYGPRRVPPPHKRLPASYACRKADTAGIQWNLSSWDHAESCSVTGVTTRAFAPGVPACVSLEVAYRPGTTRELALAYPMDAIRVRRGLVDLIPSAVSRRRGAWSVRFCDEDAAGGSGEGYSMFTIAWVDTANWAVGAPPFLLRRIVFEGP